MTPKYPDNLFFKKPILTVILLVLAANSVGGLAMTFFMLFIAPIPQGSAAVSQASSREIAWIVIGQLVLVVVGNILVRASNRYFSKWYARLQTGEAHQNIPEAARREVLNFPLRMSLITLVIWTLAAVFFGWGISRSLVAALGSFLVGGVFSAVLTYFGVELFWRRILVIFFPAGRLRDTRAFRLSVFARLLVVFLVISIYPVALLIILSLSRAQTLISAPNPQTILDNLFMIEMFLLAVSLVSSVGMAYFVYRTISAPVNRLEQAMARVANNDLQVRVTVNSNDEIGNLSDRFNDMTQGLQQGEQLRNLLNLYVSPQVAREALEHGTALGGQLVTCSVLFSDIRGFTSLSEQLPPERLIRMLNRYMSVMVESIVANDGMVNKFGGDSLLAVFGTPLNPNPAHATAAIRAGLAMLRALEAFNQKQRADGEPQLKIGIGVASGPVVAGNIGGEARIEYTVIGDTVNLASRLQSMTKETGVEFLIDKNTVTRVNPDTGLKFMALAPLMIRGKQEPVEVYTIHEQGGDE
jgi:class 3 adenylate cyclase